MRRTEWENERDRRAIEEMSTRRLALITTNKQVCPPYNDDRYLDTTRGYVLTLIKLKINLNKKISILSIFIKMNYL